ncbi:hypothetical protein F2Q70_00043821 [Brassica cretica]|uniref:ABC transporter domain-containing protein n=1 Tax=Brassica cretica TaxID=69181 RepID=A0A8S9KFE9_BRACR|nr:hypothetical protein F2Q70_00043821 [Brassica cretica]
MANMAGADEIESLRVELAEIGRSIRSSFHRHTSSFRSGSSRYEPDRDGEGHDTNAEYALQWAEIERLPTVKRIRSTLLDDGDESMTEKGKRVVDVTKLGAMERHLMIEKLIKHIENDNLKLLKKIRRRIDRVGMELPTIEVRYEGLKVEAECEIVEGKALPTLWNTAKRVLSELVKLTGAKTREAKISILNDVSGIIKPGRLTLLLGPPGCGKTTLLKALSGNLENNLKCSGEISYNGHRLDEFVPQKTSAYISQYDLHIAEMTVRETVDFSARCQGVGSRTEIMMEVSKREKEAGIIPDTEVDAYMKAISVEGLERSLQTDYILKILGLDICAETLIGDVMRRGISGGQKKRLTTAEMIVGPTKALFMDEITNGLDNTQQSVFTVVGAIYGAVLFLGINNCSSAIRNLETERNVMYRERFAGMYSATAYALGQVVTEIPYLFIQAAEFVIITYPMIGFYASTYKVFWALYSMFTSLLTYNYLAMFLISITPNFMVASILQSIFYVNFNLFSGFLIPETEVPRWWIWLYYITPTSWTLNGFFSSQYENIHEEIIVFGESTTASKFLEDYFGFHHDRLAVTAVVQIAFPIALALMFAFFVGKLNFQRR